MRANNFEGVAQPESYGAKWLLQVKQHMKCISPMTFSQELHQFNALGVAQEYEQAIEENSLEKIKKLLDKLVRLSS